MGEKSGLSDRLKHEVLTKYESRIIERFRHSLTARSLERGAQSVESRESRVVSGAMCVGWRRVART